MDYTHAGHYGPEPFLDPSGNALAGAEVTVLEADGATLATLYADSDKEVAGDNPFATDAAGNGDFYADPGTYVLEVRVGGFLRLTDTVSVPLDPDEFADHVDNTELHGAGSGEHPTLEDHELLGLAAADDVAAAILAHAETPHGASDVGAHEAADDPHGSQAYTDTEVAAATSAASDALGEHVADLGEHGGVVVLIELDGGLADVMPRPDVPFVWYRLKTNPEGVLDNLPTDAVDNVTGAAW